MKEKFIEWNPIGTTQETLDQAIQIIAEYRQAGYRLSLRQLYYQLVSRDAIPNYKRQYSRLSRVISDARLAGLIDWDAIEDRGRQLVQNNHWEEPGQILYSAAASYRIDKWQNQFNRVYVMVEKDALSGVLLPICRELDVYFSANKGYSSQTHLYETAKQMERDHENGQRVILLYFGDFDPSGLDMDRDIMDRCSLFLDYKELRFTRLALTKDQIDKYNPPPNPTKTTDSRSTGYIEQYGHTLWELDALRPDVLADLVRENVVAFRDEDAWDEMVEREEYERSRIEELAESWE